MASINLKHELVTQFHKYLATPEWLSALAQALAIWPFLNGPGVVRSDYSEERYMGAQSVVKYRFVVTIDTSQGHNSPIQTGFEVKVTFIPGEQGFKIDEPRWGVAWNQDNLCKILTLERLASESVLQSLCREGESVVNELVLRGLLTRDILNSLLITYANFSKFDWSVCAPDPNAAQLMSRADARNWQMAPISRGRNLMLVAIAEPTKIERLNAYGQGISIVPIVASLTDVEALQEEIYGPRHPVELIRVAIGEQLPGAVVDGSVDSRMSSPLEPWKKVLQLHIEDWLDRKGLPGHADVVKVEIVVQIEESQDLRKRSVSQCHHHYCGVNGAHDAYFLSSECLSRDVTQGEWSELFSLTQADGVWTDYLPEVSHVLEQWWTLQTWTRDGHRRCQQRAPGLGPYFECFVWGNDPGRGLQCPPFLECCLAVLRLSFDVSEEREVHWA